MFILLIKYVHMKNMFVKHENIYLKDDIIIPPPQKNGINNMV